jgi:hypothetical protein
MKSTIFKSTVLALIVASPMSVVAAESSQTSAVSNNPIEAIVNIPIAGVRIATGVVAIPLMIVGEIGSVSGQAGEKLWQQANGHNNKPMQSVDTKSPISNERFL